MTRAVELAFWKTVQESHNKEMIEAYLKKYPVGEFKELAISSWRHTRPRRISQLPTRAVRGSENGRAVRLVLDRQLGAIVDVGRGDRRMTHCHYDLVETAHDAAGGIEPVNRGPVVIVDDERAGVVVLGT